MLPDLPQITLPNLRRIFCNQLKKHGFTRENITKHLLLDTPKLLRKAQIQNLVEDGSPLSTLIRLFFFGENVSTPQLESVFTVENLQFLEECQIVEKVESHAWQALFHIQECQGLYLLSDLRNLQMESDAVWITGFQTFNLIPFLPESAESVLDIGSGNGFLALLLATKSQSVVGLDINDRATQLARFNAWLNDIDNVEFLTCNFQDVHEKYPDGFTFVTSTLPDIRLKDLPVEKAPISMKTPGGLQLMDDLFRCLHQVCRNEGSALLWQGCVDGREKYLRFLKDDLLPKHNIHLLFTVIAITENYEKGVFARYILRKIPPKDPKHFLQTFPTVGFQSLDDVLQAGESVTRLLDIPIKETTQFRLRPHAFINDKWDSEEIGTVKVSKPIRDVVKLCTQTDTLAEALNQYFERQGYSEEEYDLDEMRDSLIRALRTLVQKGILEVSP